MSTTATTLDRQLDLFTGAVRRALGMRKVLTKTDAGWRESFESTALHLLASNCSVTAEEVVAVVGYPPNCSKNAIGATMRSVALKHGLLPSYVRAQRVSRHASVVCRWSRN